MDFKKPFSELNILVIGDVMIDHYMKGKFERISPEAPVPIVDVISELTTPGGAGNVIENLISYGVVPSILSVVGNDASGEELISIFKKVGIPTDGIFMEEDRLTSKKSRVMVASHQMIRIDKETKAPISVSSQQKIIHYLESVISKVDILLVSDYAKGVLTDELLAEIFKIANQHKVMSIVDPKGKNYAKYKGASIVKPNKKEAIEASGITINSRADLERAATYLKELTQCNALVVTLSEEGLAIFGDETIYLPTKATEVFDVTGAGDTVLATIGTGLAAGLSLKDSCILANHAAAIVIAKVGSATAKMNEVLDHIQQN
jgi:D-beta-D-heptose 7-phosphate kinase/D-beta-D-heptose 1-phosphate adenosyltransferase